MKTQKCRRGVCALLLAGAFVLQLWAQDENREDSLGPALATTPSAR